MATRQVQAIISVKSESFHQILEESVPGLSATDPSFSYEELIAANERLRINLSKIFTEFVNKARLEQETNGDQKKRKMKHDDDENEDGEDDDEDGEPSDNDEEEQ